MCPCWLVVVAALFASPLGRAATTSVATPFSFNHSGSVTTGTVAALATVSNTTTTPAPSLTLAKFDPTLGTLTQVQVAFVTSSSAFSVQSTGLASLITSSSFNLALNYTAPSGGSGSASASTSGSTLVTVGGSSSQSVASPALTAAANTLTFSAAADLANYTGTGATLSVGLSAIDAFSVSTTASAANGAGYTGSGSYGGTVTVTYTYTPATGTTPPPVTVPPTVTAPAITSQPASAAVTVGQPANFGVTASAGNGTLAYQWSKNGAAISGATAAVYSIPSAQTSDAGSYSVAVSNAAGAVTSTAATLAVGSAGSAVAAPVISTQPVGQSATVGQAVSFVVGAANGAGTLTYQWNKGGSPIAGATAALFSIPNAQSADAALYTVTVANAGGNVTSYAAPLTVGAASVPATAPVITAQPSSVSVAAGQTAALSVGTSSGGALQSYQWSRNGAAIAGATASSYFIAIAQTTDAGAYTNTVSNSAGSVTSNPATLAVGAGSAGTGGTATTPAAVPQIITQPSSQAVAAGSSATFGPVVSGSGPFTYQWYRNGAQIAGATASTYTVASPQPANAADYTVAITNAAGSVSSSDAYLYVIGGLLAGAGQNMNALVNGSNRGTIVTPQNTMIGGFVNAGGVHQYLVRAVGPSLSQFGFANLLSAVQLTLYRGPSIVVTNSNPAIGGGDAASLSAATAAVGAFALMPGNLDAAVLVTVPAGPYTVLINGVNNATGVVLFEVYFVN